jgi:hypothetical protein
MDVARQRIPQRLGMLGVQVDLVIGAVQTEADSAFEQCLKPVDLPGRARAKEGVPSR